MRTDLALRYPLPRPPGTLGPWTVLSLRSEPKLTPVDAHTFRLQRQETEIERARQVVRDHLLDVHGIEPEELDVYPDGNGDYVFDLVETDGDEGTGYLDRSGEVTF